MVTATFVGCDARDMIDRPVKFNGFGCAIIKAVDEATVIIQSGDTEPITVALTDCVPLCVGCLGTLEESEYESPGECVTPACFFYRGV